MPATPFLWVDDSAPVEGERFYRALAMDAPMDMVFIPSGAFRMGTPVAETGHQSWEGPQTEVAISRGFWIGKFEVTKERYVAVTGVNPSQFKADSRAPVESVTWNDAVGFCAALTIQKRLAERIPNGTAYRLPTEAEWAYACRALTSTRFSYGDDPDYVELTDYAWYWDNSDWQRHPGGQKLPNPWGLYDMHGNVWE